jgi:hypothetical protein
MVVAGAAACVAGNPIGVSPDNLHSDNFARGGSRMSLEADTLPLHHARINEALRSRYPVFRASADFKSIGYS